MQVFNTRMKHTQCVFRKVPWTEEQIGDATSGGREPTQKAVTGTGHIGGFPGEEEEWRNGNIGRNVGSIGWVAWGEREESY